MYINVSIDKYLAPDNVRTIVCCVGIFASEIALDAGTLIMDVMAAEEEAKRKNPLVSYKFALKAKLVLPHLVDSFDAGITQLLCAQVKK